MRTRPIAWSVLLAGAAWAAASAPAGAHTEIAPEKAAAGERVTLTVTVPHGCDGAATNLLRLRIPRGVVDVTAERVPGWEAEVSHDEVVWRGGPLDDGDEGEFPLEVTMPSDVAGGVVRFGAIQGCVDGSEVAWIEVAADGETEDDLEYPAPVVELVGTRGGGAERAPKPNNGGSNSLLPVAAGAAVVLSGATILMKGKRRR